MSGGKLDARLNCLPALLPSSWPLPCRERICVLTGRLYEDSDVKRRQEWEVSSKCCCRKKNSSGRFFGGHQTSCYVTVIKTVSSVDFDLATEGLKRIVKVV